jgi:hypothetical protein
MWDVMLWDLTEDRLVCLPTFRLVELWVKLEYVCSSQL